MQDVQLNVPRNGLVEVSPGIVATIETSKPLLRFFRLAKLDAPLKTVTLPQIASAVAVSRDGCLLACGTARGDIFLWDLTTGHLLK